jgi:hypothetical protein
MHPGSLPETAIQNNTIPIPIPIPIPITKTNNQNQSPPGAEDDSFFEFLKRFSLKTCTHCNGTGFDEYRHPCDCAITFLQERAAKEDPNVPQEAHPGEKEMTLQQYIQQVQRKGKNRAFKALGVGDNVGDMDK